MLLIGASPDTKMPFLKNWGQNIKTDRRGPRIYEYKTTFAKMRLLCGDKEVEPIWPNRRALGAEEGRYAVIEGNSYEGAYQYRPDAISPDCGQVTLELYSTKDAKPITRVIEPKVVTRIWQDFEPYRKLQATATQ